ncbi:MAG: hypothetical protein UMR38_03565 [Candidatus Izemoplasma sp.]|nr:hypothetical protein [Candidatus Izemoplasma sp.]
MADNNFAQFIEELRISRNLSREDFVDGIISTRQYQRFLNGESSIKNNNMTDLLERLEINSIDIYYQYLATNDDYIKKLTDAYQAYFNRNLLKTTQILSNINSDNISNDYYLKYYRFLKINTDIQLKKVPTSMGMEKLKELVDYPNILEHKILNFIEINILISLSDYIVTEEKDFRIANYLFDKLKSNPKLPNLSQISYKPALYSYVARTLGHIKEYEKSLQIAKTGLEICEKYQIYAGVNSLLYYHALGEKYVYDDKRHLETLRRLYFSLHIFNETPRTKTYKKFIQKNFSVSFEDLFEIKNA